MLILVHWICRGREDFHAKFKELRDAGKIPRGVRFQVSLPTPLAVVFAFFIPSDIRKVWPVYEQRLFDEVDEIVATIPQKDLASNGT